MKDKIICLVGESGSGKTTIAGLLEKEGYNYIQSYTTRKPRYEGEKGHIFVDNAPTVLNVHGFSKEDISKAGIIAYTFFDNAHYWATREQYQDKGTSIYIIDVAGIKELKEIIKDAEIVVIYLKTSRIARVARMLQREGYDLLVPTPTEIYEKISQRATHDDETFKNVEWDYMVNANNSIEEVLEGIKTILSGDI